jgi:hypothetical protein
MESAFTPRRLNGAHQQTPPRAGYVSTAGWGGAGPAGAAIPLPVPRYCTRRCKNLRAGDRFRLRENLQGLKPKKFCAHRAHLN